MTATHALIMFLDALEHSPLSDDDKLELKESAEANGVSKELWSRLNDRLIATLVRNRNRRREWRARIDDEVARFTSEYEKKKSVIDRKMMDYLQAAESEDEKQRLWEDYGREIGILQGELVSSVRDTSQTVLKEAFEAMVVGV